MIIRTASLNLYETTASNYVIIRPSYSTICLNLYDFLQYMAESRYTLSLPTEIYNELREIAERRGLSVKDVVRQCLKIGLVAIKLDEDPDKELLVKEKL